MSKDAGSRAEQVKTDTETMLEWWIEYTNDAGATTVPKAVDYGGSDLAVLGNSMAALLHLEGADADTREKLGQMAALAFYMQGKIGRILSALAEGRMPNEDHEFDIMVYAIMFRRIRETGQWP